MQETAFPISPAEANFGLKGSNFYLSRNLPTVVEAVTEVDTLPYDSSQVSVCSENQAVLNEKRLKLLVLSERG